eukprot:12771709-Heterocapsa_arctica.AAC.1
MALRIVIGLQFATSSGSPFCEHDEHGVAPIRFWLACFPNLVALYQRVLPQQVATMLEHLGHNSSFVRAAQPFVVDPV